MRWPCHGCNTHTQRYGGPSRGFPGRPAGAHSGTTEGLSSADLMAPRIGPGFPVFRTAVGNKLCPHRGGREASRLNTARGTPRFRRSRVSLPLCFRIARSCSNAGPMRPGVPRAPRGAPEEIEEGVPGADTTIRAAERWLFFRGLHSTTEIGHAHMRLRLLPFPPSHD